MTQARSQPDRTTAVLPPSPAGIARAADLLRQGALVAFGTETVYGLGADATNPAAIRRIYAAKGRPRCNPLILHVASLAMARRFALFTPAAESVVARFWRGPLTLVLPARADAGLSPDMLAGLSTVAVRFPASAVARDLIAALGRPLAAPSANLSGRVSATSGAEVMRQLGGRIDAVIDSGATPLGVESTILSLVGAPRLLRHGAVPVEDLEPLLGALPGPEKASAITAPGQLASHYAPLSAVRMDVQKPAAGEFWIGFGDCPGADMSLSPGGDVQEAARNLFAVMAAADARLGGRGTIAFAPVPPVGLGRTINDRLARATAPRPVAENHGEMTG